MTDYLKSSFITNLREILDTWLIFEVQFSVAWLILNFYQVLNFMSQKEQVTANGTNKELFMFGKYRLFHANQKSEIKKRR